MYNILYYDMDYFNIYEAQEMVASLKKQLPEEMSKKLIVLPKHTELVNYYEEQDLKQGGALVI